MTVPTRTAFEGCHEQDFQDLFACKYYRITLFYLFSSFIFKRDGWEQYREGKGALKCLAGLHGRILGKSFRLKLLTACLKFCAFGLE